MSDEPTERDFGWLTAVLRDADDLAYDNMHAAWARESIARSILSSDWYADRIAEARREGAAEAWDEGAEAVRQYDYHQPPVQNPYRAALRGDA